MHTSADNRPQQRGYQRDQHTRGPRLSAFLAVMHGVALHGGVVSFDGLLDMDSVGPAYATQGVTFDHAVVLGAGLSLNEVEFPPSSGSNVASDDGAPITGVFGTPASFLSGRFTYTVPITIRGYDASHVEVLSVTSAFLSNTASSGNPPNELLSLSFPAGIHSFRIEGDPLGGSFALDDFTFTTVPEASSAAAAGMALAAFAVFRRRLAGRLRMGLRPS